MLKPQAFIVAGTEREPREADEDGSGAGARACSATSGRWQTIVAPRGHHESLADDVARRSPSSCSRRPRRLTDARASRTKTEYLPGRPELGPPGRRADRPPVPRLLRPAADPAPHRRGAGRRGAVRHPRGHLPVLPPGARRGRRSRAARLRGLRASVCFAPYAVALAVRAVGRAAPPRRRLRHGHGRAARERGRDAAKVLRLLSTLGGPAYNLVLHTAPLRQRVDETYHWHWEIHPRLREIAGLELGTGLPVNPVCPEEAVHELLATARAEAIDTGVAVGPRSWDDFGGAERTAGGTDSVTHAHMRLSITLGAQRHSEPCAARHRAVQRASCPGLVHVTRDVGDCARACVERLYAAHHAEIYATWPNVARR